MEPSPTAITRAYLEHLTPRDRELIAGVDPDWAVPGGLERVLDGTELFGVVFGPAGVGEPLLLGTSPFLVFAVAVHHVRRHLTSVTHVSEWLGPGRRTPVFEVASLRDFLDGTGRRLFLAELLASYTHVASGSVVVSTRRGRRRQRFSELDPVRLAALLEVVPDADRPGVLRRLGDLALFLTGVFPDHVARRGFGPVEETRLRRSGRLSSHLSGTAAPDRDAVVAFGDPGAVGLLERLGRTWYGAAAELLVPPVPASLAVLAELPARFGQARRILDLLTDQLLFAQRDRWFGIGG